MNVYSQGAEGAQSSSSKVDNWILNVEGALEYKYDVQQGFVDVVLSITEGMRDFEYTMRNVCHKDIATVFVKQQLKEAKAMPDDTDV